MVKCEHFASPRRLTVNMGLYVEKLFFPRDKNCVTIPDTDTTHKRHSAHSTIHKIRKIGNKSSSFQKDRVCSRGTQRNGVTDKTFIRPS